MSVVSDGEHVNVVAPPPPAPRLMNQPCLIMRGLIVTGLTYRLEREGGEVGDLPGGRPGRSEGGVVLGLVREGRRVDKLEERGYGLEHGPGRGTRRRGKREEERRRRGGGGTIRGKEMNQVII